MKVGLKITKEELQMQGWVIDGFDGKYETWVNGYLYIKYNAVLNIVKEVNSV